MAIGLPGRACLVAVSRCGGKSVPPGSGGADPVLAGEDSGRHLDRRGRRSCMTSSAI